MKMKVYVARKGESIEKAIEKKDVEMVRTYTTPYQHILQLFFPGNKKMTLDVGFFDFWIVPQS